MSNISDLIEQYLKKLIEKAGQGQIEIQRNELATQFSCVPSQINYVLSTRFSMEHGYLVESRRGGGGYVRIVKLELDEKSVLVNYLSRLIGDDITQQGAEGIIGRLWEEELVTRRELEIMKAAVNRDVLRMSLPARDNLRASILKAMLVALLK
ncbi:transcriptional regulator CtsR [Desulfocucumis palustris]|uniref:Transcriptional regulator CtsR n=1 Tax=Desulfocucumis palustris TaxID=1898651 RepID=A0A2L2XHM0_9FIRM|nr:CtsR family transcriptional regulator [Desulfocucumis palustris]GBF35738.1 transcriptional regulator CtsR [Desulfocucumis palustris]